MRRRWLVLRSGKQEGDRPGDLEIAPFLACQNFPGGNDNDQLDGGQGNDDVCHGGSGADAFANCENYRTSPNELSLLIG